ncbi:MAG: hypothetical protein C4527_12525 [Candidatus Omnitrophota bacterium]|jgi:hypothetical protein|nr:MAG: hypothetical protein C4527_12525 [Candidatus Omnitrophota bacterium]
MAISHQRNFLLYLKALIWSVFISYTDSTIAAIVQCLRAGQVGDEFPEFRDTHLGEGLRFLISALPREEDRVLLASCLGQVKKSESSMVYRNMVIEVGHYVTAQSALGDVPSDCAGVVYCLNPSSISVIFRKPDGTLSDKQVHPFQVMPIYTLTVPDPSE